MSEDYLWDRSGAPDPFVAELEEKLARFRHRPRRRRRLLWLAAPAAAAAAVLLAALLWPRAPRPAWEVEWLAGGGAQRLAVGEWLQTDDRSRARIAVADIGHVEVDPSSRVRLVGTSEEQHRLNLARGRIEATVYAPPRLFVVDTPAATAVDLGCAYALEVDDRGHGLLRVVSGYVQLEAEGRPSAFVPGGASCRFVPGKGPGVPYYAGAPEALLADEAAPEAFAEGLAQARPQDALTLWHLLARVAGDRRADVHDRLADLKPPPAGTPREKVLALDAEALDAWLDEIR